VGAASANLFASHRARAAYGRSLGGGFSVNSLPELSPLRPPSRPINRGVLFFLGRSISPGLCGTGNRQSTLRADWCPGRFGLLTVRHGRIPAFPQRMSAIAPVNDETTDGAWPPRCAGFRRAQIASTFLEATLKPIQKVVDWKNRCDSCWAPE